jgi:hypothetical protein
MGAYNIDNLRDLQAMVHLVEIWNRSNGREREMKTRREKRKDSEKRAP